LARGLRFLEPYHTASAKERQASYAKAPMKATYEIFREYSKLTIWLTMGYILRKT